MPRRLRIEFEGAIHHVMARGNARQTIVRDDEDRRRLVDGIEQAVTRCGWELLSFVIMSNHLHLLVKTPRPNLGAGMQSVLSGYAAWSGRRHRRAGHLFQGRYRTEMIEDASYYWSVSRYIHLNPVRAGLVTRPEQWEWSSYPGYRYLKRAQPWVAHEALLAAWEGDRGGGGARKAYVRFVEAGLTHPPQSPFREAIGGWILGSDRFVGQLRERVQSRAIASNPPLPEARALAAPALDPDRIIAAVAEYYGLDMESFSRRYDPHIARAAAAWLCRRHTQAPLRILAGRLGLSRADSVPNLTRRLERRLESSPELALELSEITERVTAPGAPGGGTATAKRESKGPRKTKNKG